MRLEIPNVGAISGIHVEGIPQKCCNQDTRGERGSSVYAYDELLVGHKLHKCCFL